MNKIVMIISIVVAVLGSLFLLTLFSSVKNLNFCKNLVAVDMGAAADGPLLYIELPTFKHLATCGGACMMGNCQNCPPKEWTCN